MKKIIALLLALSMVFALCACGGSEAPAADTADDAAAESDLAYVQGKGSLIVGITDFAPMDYKDENGEWIGFDADMAKAFAESLGVSVEFIEIDWDNKILELDSKSIDAVWNGMTLTDEVLNSMECSKPYCKNAQVVVVKSEVADQYQDVESLSDLAFAVEAGSAGESAVKDLGLEDYTAVPTQADALMNVAAGTADACVIDLLMAGAMIGEGTSYDQLTYTVSLTEENYGVGFRKGSDLAAAFNEFYAAAFADGTVEEIATTYRMQDSIVAE
ncbi:MAG: transporter substrate-binding domain-containing protein [Oscillospiraceae bacterium]